MGAYFSVEGGLGLVVFLFGVWLSLGNISKSGHFRSIDFSLLSMAVVYGLAMPAVFAAAKEDSYLGAEFISRSPDVVFLHSFSSMTAMIGTVIGWKMTSGRVLNSSGRYFSGIRNQSFPIIFFLMTCLAAIAWYLYLMDYGGFLGYFDYNRLIRSQIFDSFDRSRFSFLSPFGEFAIISFFGFWGLASSRETRSPFVYAGIVISFLLSGYILLANAGRVAMAATIAIPILSLLAKRRIHPILWFLGYFAVIFFGGLFLFWISNALDLKGGENIGKYIVREASYPFVGFFAQIERGYLFHLFHDVFASPLYLAPSSLTSGWLQEASEINTEVVIGVKKGIEGNTTGVPTDMITYGLMQFHILGVLIYAILFGFVLRIADSLAKSVNHPGVRSVFQTYVFIKLAMFGVFYAQPKLLIMTHFALIVTLLCGIALRTARSALLRVG